ncbi:MAG: Acetyl-/propionyl-coenzyme A carboxylase alpha chain [Alphaproteobacteria bacterium MarineAlpha9_Bin4]|nr:MAG: Acetyl-/propionyl-coenzyme A carboxylase alpha chain [Alphaproteobacteria bacterium MarineAlpha9_Bin4]
MKKKIKKILIGNRGEIAVRIAKTCKKLNIKTVGIFSKEDESSYHLDGMDEKVFLSNDPLNESYLNIKKIIQICKKMNVDAVHPGYGFLSENYLFSKELSKNNIIFIGPPANAVKEMGDKISSKKIALKAKVNCIPGINKEIRSLEEASKVSNNIGFPVMIKASAGGGGKGMRIVRKKKDLSELLKSAKNEAKNAFGDDRVFIEKYIENPRHIEIQVLGDKFGNIISLGERECSIQRRHQKIIEEAPSAFLDEVTRKKMGDQAVSLAKQVKYYSAGTVEFVVDKNKNFYFLEMNTRLQVEHPVTEEVTGVDLVKEMIKISEGNKLSLTQENLKIQGWSIEARLCSEDPKKDFLPSAGKIKKLVFPEKVRVDKGYIEGGTVSIYYDSLIAKIITKGRNRKEAINKMIEALQVMNIDGIKTNQDFLINILLTKEFSLSKIDTNFIEKNYKSGFKGKTGDVNILEIMAITALSNKLKYLKEINNDLSKISKNWTLVLEDKLFNFKLSTINDSALVLIKDNKKFYIELFVDPSSLINKIKINDNFYNLRITQNENLFKVFYNGYISKINIFRNIEYKSYTNLPKNKLVRENNYLVSPMPGKVVDVLVKKNSIVNSGETLIILDAMKMENILKSDSKVKILEIFVGKGEAVSAEQNLIKFKVIK